MIDEVQMHSFRVALLAIEFGEYLQMRENEIFTICTASLLHDYGKNFISKEILFKPCKLDASEYSVIKRHPKIAYDKLKNSMYLNQEVLRVIKEHHERVDGCGYPFGLKGNQICYMSKIVSLCDCYDAMRSVRAYKQGITIEDSLNEINNNLNTQFSEYYGKKFISFIEGKEGKMRIADEMYNMW